MNFLNFITLVQLGGLAERRIKLMSEYGIDDRVLNADNVRFPRSYAFSKNIFSLDKW